MTDYVKASINSACDSVPEYSSSACVSNPNYLSSDSNYFLITPHNSRGGVARSFVQSNNQLEGGISGGTLSGAGLKSDTYVIYEYVDSENDSTPTPDTNTPSQVVEVLSTSAYVSLIISVAGIVLVVLAIGIIYFTSKKKKLIKINLSNFVCNTIF